MLIARICLAVLLVLASAAAASAGLSIKLNEDGEIVGGRSEEPAIKEISPSPDPAPQGLVPVEPPKELVELVEGLRLSPAIGKGGLGDSGRRLALVVGNNKYEHLKDLVKARGDAESLTTVLYDLGFDVTTLFDVNVDQLDDALHAFYEALQPGDVAFFFFAGHGVADGDTNYLLPVDIPKLGELERNRLKRKAFDAGEIVAEVKAKGARLAFFVLDACREDPFRRDEVRGATTLGGLTRMLPTEGAFVIYSAGTGQTALDSLEVGDANPNSVFSRKFFPILQTPGLPIVEIAKRTQVEVRELAAKVAHKQAPAYYDQVIGQFYFKAPEPALYGLTIGVDEYDRKKMLQGAVNDAERVSRALEALGAEEVVRIFDRDARRNFIDFAWRSLVKRAKAGDTIVFSYAGSSHQYKGPNAADEADGLDEFLMLADAPWNAQVFEVLAHRVSSIISDDTLTDWMELAAEKNVNVILLIDGCHGGGLLDREFANVSFLGASAEDELVNEILVDGRYHAAMSVAFADGIEGAADLNGDGFVTQRELYAKMSFDVHDLIKGAKQTPQFSPDIFTATNDLALFKLPDDISARTKAIAKKPWLNKGLAGSRER
ncbi:MAG: caspase domain-containing protein [Rhizobiaceae bacterium]